MGHPARLVGAVLDLSLDARLAHCDSAAILKDIKQELELALVGMTGCGWQWWAWVARVGVTGS